MKIEFHGKEYPTKKAFTQFVNSRLSQMAIGFHLPDTDSFVFLHELYKRHPNYNSNIEKFHIEPQRQGEEISRYFNGVYDIFSKHACINQKCKSGHDKSIALLRDCIRPQIESFRKSSICEICKTSIGNEVDHVLPFYEIVQQFNGNIDCSFNSLLFAYDFIDPTTKNIFYDFHKEKATYRMVCHPCNIKAYHHFLEKK